MRKALVAVAVVVLVLILAVILLPRLVSLHSLKPRIVAALEEKTGRRVDFSRLSLSLFPAIGVKVADLSVSGDARHPEESFLRVPEAEIRLAILPLLRGRAEFGKLLLRRPAILFRRYRDGETSLTGIAGRAAGPPPAPAPGEESGVTVSLRSLSVEDARLSLRLEDEAGRVTPWEIAPLSLHLSGFGGTHMDFDLSTRISGAIRGGISFGGTATRERRPGGGDAYTLKGKGSVFDQPVSLEGKTETAGTGTGFAVTADFPRIAMDRLPAVFAAPPAPLASARPEGLGRLVVKASGSGKEMGFQADADLTRAGWTMGGDIRKPVDAPCTLVVQGRRLPDRILISNAELKMSPLLLTARASYVPSSGAHEWTLSSRVASLAELARLRSGGLPGWSPTGGLAVSGAGTRSSAKAKESWKVDADLTEVGFQVPGRGLGLRSLNGRIEGTPQSVSFSPLSGLLNGQRFSLRGPVALGPVPRGQLDLAMAYLDVDALAPPGGKGGVSPPSEEKTAGETKGAGMSARVNVRIDAGKARGVEFRDLAGTAVYEKDGLTLDNVRARVFGGEALVSGRIGLGAPAPSFRVRIRGKDLATGGILGLKASLKDLVQGDLDVTADLGGGMKNLTDFARTATGSGSVKVADGRIRGLDLLSTAASLSGLEALVPGARPAPAGGAVKGETPFSDMSASFRLDAGKIRTDSLRLVSDKLGLSGSAVIGLDKSLDFRGVLTLPKGVSSRVRGGAGRFLVDSSGRVTIPLIMSGALTSPSVAVDTQALARGAGGRLLKGLEEKVPGLAPRTGPPGPAGDNTGQAPPAGDEPRKAVEGLFKKLLPGK